MTVHVLDRGSLTPQQILAGALNDNIDEVEAVIVCRLLKDGRCLWDWSDTSTSKLSWAASQLQHLAMETTFNGK